MDNCNKSCSDCKTELSAVLSEIPSKWRGQLVTALCQTIDNYGVSCSSVLTCINNEMDTLDYSCLAASASEWEAYNYIQKWQKIIDQACLNAVSPDFSATSSSLVITIGGDQGHEPVIELVPSTDASNALILGTDGLPYVPALAQTSLTVNDSNSIDFTASGTANHTLTGSVRLNATNNLITVGVSGLLVDSTAVSPVLTFDNGLTRTTNNIQLGGTLIQDTTLAAAAFDFKATHTLGTDDFLNGTLLHTRFATGSVGTEKESALELTPNGINLQNALKTDYVTNGTYYTNGVLDITGTYGQLGWHLPDGASPGSLDPKNSSYVKFEEALTNLYSNKFVVTSPTNTQSSGNLINGRRYVITAAGGTFTSSGAASNAVGTIFTANTTPPTWSTSSVKLVGEIQHNTVGYRGSVSHLQDDSTISTSCIDTTADIINIDYNRATLSVNIMTDYSEWSTNSYYAWGEMTLNAGLSSNAATAYTRIGHYTPTSNDATPAPALTDTATIDNTSMLTFTHGVTTLFSKDTVFETGLLVKAQNAVGTRAASSIVDIQSTTKGFRLPTMTAVQRAAIVSPADGLMVYQTNGTNGVYVYDNATTAWRKLTW